MDATPAPISQRRLAAALARLGRDDDPSDPANLDGLIEGISLAAESVGDRIDGCEISVRRLQATLDHLLEGVVVCDEDGHEVYRNEAASEFVGSRLGGAVAASAIKDYLGSARTGQKVEHLLELFSPTRRVLSIRAFPLHAAHEAPIGAVAIVEDVSERRRVDAIRRDFVANVSHELKTPVGAMSLLAETLDGEDDPEVVARLSSRLSTEADRLARIIDDLLDLSRIEANETPTLERITVQSILSQAVEGLRPLAEAGGIEIDLRDPHPDLHLQCDRWEMVSAVANLVDNAVKYSEPGGCVTVQAGQASGAAEDGDWVEITVSDHGIGIPKRDLERVFERFYRVDRARSRTTGGTGLGLSIVRHVVANHHGTVRVESTEGVGSRFTLVLPLTPSQASRRAGGGPRIPGGPSAIEPAVVESAGSVVPGTAVPGTAVPGTAVPGTAVPGTAVPGTASPGMDGATDA